MLKTTLDFAEDTRSGTQLSKTEVPAGEPASLNTQIPAVAPLAALKPDPTSWTRSPSLSQWIQAEEKLQGPPCAMQLGKHQGSPWD